MLKSFGGEQAKTAYELRNQWWVDNTKRRAKSHGYRGGKETLSTKFCERIYFDEWDFRTGISVAEDFLMKSGQFTFISKRIDNPGGCCTQLKHGFNFTLSAYSSRSRPLMYLKCFWL